MDHQQGFIEEVVRSGGVCERDQVMNLYQTNPDLERYSDWSASWKTRRFKDIAAGMGYQVNPGRTGRRHMPSIQNGKNISIHFTEDEIPLLDEFEQYRKQNYINRSGWVKQHMKKALTENKRQLAFR